MSWRNDLSPNTPTWRAVEEYVAERSLELTQLCVAPESSESEIRRAQAGIIELARLADMPTLLAAEARAKSQMTTRKEY